MSDVRLVITMLGTIGILAVLGIIYLASQSLPTPSVLEVLAGNVVGAIGAVLVRGRETPTPPPAAG